MQRQIILGGVTYNPTTSEGIITLADEDYAYIEAMRELTVALRSIT